MSKLSLIIPCYNEGKNLPLLLDRVKEIIGACKELDVILVDNGSNDNTQDFMKSMVIEKKLERVSTHRLQVNKGYGFGIHAGLKKATGDFLAWTHADMQTDLKDVLIAWDKLMQDPTPSTMVIKGERKNRNFLNVIFTIGMAIISSMALKVRMWDINAQPKIIPRDLFLKLSKAPKDFSRDLYVLWLTDKHQFRLQTIPVYFGKRLHGEAKGGGSLKTKFKLIRRTFSYIFKLKKQLNKETY